MAWVWAYKEPDFLPPLQDGIELPLVLLHLSAHRNSQHKWIGLNIIGLLAMEYGDDQDFIQHCIRSRVNLVDNPRR